MRDAPLHPVRHRFGQGDPASRSLLRKYRSLVGRFEEHRARLDLRDTTELDQAPRPPSPPAPPPRHFAARGPRAPLAAPRTRCGPRPQRRRRRV